jgi:CPA2 family monovalent cation:H+ antiporter-2
MTELIELKIVLILTVGFTFASLLGYLAYRIKLSPIIGYLIAGYLIGPYSPGFEADAKIAEQLAEIGVILMLFGVGLHFRFEDLIRVKNIAIPGAIGQTLIASVLGTFLIYSFGWPIESGIIIGLAIGVASTVILVRMLTENNLLHTPQGHVAVGWLVVEDIITVIALLMVPILAASMDGESVSIAKVSSSILIILIKFVLLAIIMFTLGQKIVSYSISRIVHTKSHELFTVTILAITFVIAAGSALIFGTSIALGAFIAGMVMGRSHVKHQISANALPIKDTFVVIFFLSMGMLFDPASLYSNSSLFLGILAIILIVKPITAYLIARCLKYPAKTAIIIAVALAQIGEFSFILAEEASKFKIIPDLGYDLLVACAMVSILLNPLLFKFILRKDPDKEINRLAKKTRIDGKFFE